ncbi:MAG: hypothetical protein ACTHKX_12790 [Pseudolysinimonas sp.]
MTDSQGTEPAPPDPAATSEPLDGPVEPMPGHFIGVSVPARTEDDINRLTGMLYASRIPALLPTDAMRLTHPRVSARLLIGRHGWMRLADPAAGLIEWETYDPLHLMRALAQVFGGGTAIEMSAGIAVFDAAGEQVLGDAVADHPDPAVALFAQSEFARSRVDTFGWTARLDRMDVQLMSARLKTPIAGVMQDAKSSVVLWTPEDPEAATNAEAGLASGTLSMFRRGEARGFALVTGFPIRKLHLHWWDEVWLTVDPGQGAGRTLAGHSVADYLSTLRPEVQDQTPLVDALKLDDERASYLRALLRQPSSDATTFERLAAVLGTPVLLARVAEFGPAAAPDAELIEPVRFADRIGDAYRAEQVRREQTGKKPLPNVLRRYFRFSARHPAVRWLVNLALLALAVGLVWFGAASGRIGTIAFGVGAAIWWLIDLFTPRSAFRD